MRSEWELAVAFALDRWVQVYSVRRCGQCIACLHAHQGGYRLGHLHWAHHHDEPPVFRVTLFRQGGPDHFVRVERGKASVFCHVSHRMCHSPFG